MKYLYASKKLTNVINFKLLSYIITFVFSGIMSIYLAHMFNMAGPVFLPMHFFVFVAAISFGWRTGLITGLTLPIVSYFMSGMPIIEILPRIIIEVSAYGLIAGGLKDYFNLNSLMAVLIAMIVGRLMSGIFVFIFSDVNMFDHIFMITKLGLPGILVQIIFVLPVSNLFLKWMR